MPAVGVNSANHLVPKHWHITSFGPDYGMRTPSSRRVASGEEAAMLMRLATPEAAGKVAALLRWYNGIGCVRLMRKHRDMLLLEWLGEQTLISLQHQEDVPAIDILCEVAAKLHRKRRSVPKTALIPLDQHLRPLLEQRFSPDALMRHAARLARALLSSTTIEQPLHGDLSFENIRRHDERGWVAGLPLGLLGDPHFEYAAALAQNCNGRDLQSASRCVRIRAEDIAQRRQLDANRLLTFAFCRSALWMLSAEEYRQSSLLWRDRTLTLLDSLVDSNIAGQ